MRCAGFRMVLCDFSPLEEGINPGPELRDLRRVGGKQLFDRSMVSVRKRTTL